MISIIVPVYNVECYLEKCVDSLIRQTVKGFELILIDDGATDYSGTLCDKFALRDERIKVIHKQNGGLSDARNVGIEMASGEYLTFVDSDDYVSTKYLQILLENLLSSRADISSCSFCDVNEGKKNNEYRKNDIIYYTSKQAIHSILREEEKGISTSAWGKLFKRELFDMGFRFPKGKLYEDLFTIYLLFDSSSKIVHSYATLYYYRMNPLSIMNSPFRTNNWDIIEAHESILVYLSDKYPDLIFFARNREIRYSISYIYRIHKKGGKYLEFEHKFQHIIRKGIFRYCFSKYSYKSKLLGILYSINLGVSKLLTKVYL